MWLWCCLLGRNYLNKLSSKASWLGHPTLSLGCRQRLWPELSRVRTMEVPRRQLHVSAVLLVLLSFWEEVIPTRQEGANLQGSKREGKVYTGKSRMEATPCSVSSTAAPGAVLGPRDFSAKWHKWMKKWRREDWFTHSSQAALPKENNNVRTVQSNLVIESAFLGDTQYLDNIRSWLQ